VYALQFTFFLSSKVYPIWRHLLIEIGTIFQASKVSMETLTLARYILESSLMFYDCLHFKDSLLAAGCLLLVLRMKNEGDWVPNFGISSKKIYQINWTQNVDQNFGKVLRLGWRRGFTRNVGPQRKDVGAQWPWTQPEQHQDQIFARVPTCFIQPMDKWFFKMKFGHWFLECSSTWPRCRFWPINLQTTWLRHRLMKMSNLAWQCIRFLAMCFNQPY